MANNSLFDVLGLPKSIDAALELFVEGAIKVGSSGVQEVVAVSAETIKEVSGKGLDMNKSLVGFQEGKTKTPELLEKEQEELKKATNQRIFYKDIAEQRQVITTHAHEKALETAERFGVANMPEQEWNELLGIKNTDYSKRNTATTYHLTTGALILAERNRKKEDQDKEVSIAQKVAQKIPGVDLSLNKVAEAGSVLSSVTSAG